MCDILLATPEASEDNVMLFAKNSDRDPNEAQVLEFIPKHHPDERGTEATYVKVPQVEETNAVILSRPWWMWGAEMGVNEHGVVIGNTAVFTEKDCKEMGLLGMDMVRLALERKENAREALNYIISLIEKYGQGGNGSYEHDFYYHNSFAVADQSDAWVLETAGEEWVSRKIKGVYSISNALTIGKSWTDSSINIHSKKKEFRSSEKFDFSKKFASKPLTSDFFKTKLSRGKDRQKFTLDKLNEKEGSLTLEDMMKILRMHKKKNYKPENGSNSDVCMHYGGLIRQSQTASSQVSEIGKNNQINFFTGTSNPCLSIFKPIFFKNNLPDLGSNPTNHFNENSYWWRFERFHRKFQTNYQKYIEKFSEKRDKLQEQIIKKSRELEEGKLETTKQAFRKEEKLREEWNKKISTGSSPLLFGLNWKRINKRAGLSIDLDISLRKSIR